MNTRRQFLQAAAAASALPFVLPASAQERPFAPQPGDWRTFDVTTRVNVNLSQGATTVWLPIPSVNTDWQRCLDSNFTSNGNAKRVADGDSGAEILVVQYDANNKEPFVELTTRVQTRNRATDWRRTASEPAALG